VTGLHDVPAPPHLTGFVLDRYLGRGGMGVVYRAREERSDRVLALKLLQRVDAQGIYRLKREFRSLADITHPNLVHLHELGYVDGHWFLAMELIDGVGFFDHLGMPSAVLETGPFLDPRQGLHAHARFEARAAAGVRTAPFTHEHEARLRDAFAQAVSGLNALHAARKLHCDIKPSNLMVENGGRVVLLDFGLISEQSEKPREKPATVLGTVAYMSPEQAQGHALTPSSDWYALGVTLYQALCGVLPCSGRDDALLRAKCNGILTHPNRHAPDVPDDLAALCLELLSVEPHERPAGAEILRRLSGQRSRVSVPVLPRDSGLSDSPFVGRERELLVLREAFASSFCSRAEPLASTFCSRAEPLASTGTRAHPQVGSCAQVRAANEPARVIVITGPSGIGKSHLMRRFLREAEQEHACLVFRGRCHQRESVPYKALDAIVDALSDQLALLSPEQLQRTLPAELGILTRMFPVLKSALGMETRDSDEDLPGQLRRAFDALSLLLRNIAGGRRIVLAIEDLQWGDLESGRLLRALLEGPDAPALSVIATARDEEDEATPLLRELLRDEGEALAASAIQLLPLSALAPHEAEAMARLLLGHEASCEAVRSVAEESLGIPFFIDELSRFAFGAATSHGLELPEDSELRLDLMLQRRIHDLAADARHTLSIVAIAGGTVKQSVVSAAARLSRPALWLELINVRLLRVSGAGQVECYHDRIRGAAMLRLLPEERRAGHAALAEALDAEGSADPEQLLEHYLAAAQTARAGEYALRAAEAAGHALAFARAARLYEAALKLATPGTVQVRVLQRKLADAHANAGNVFAAAELFAALAEGASGRERLELLRHAAQHYLTGGYPERGIELIRGALSSTGLRYPSSQGGVLARLAFERTRIRAFGLGFRERAPRSVPTAELLRVDVCFSAAVGFSMNDLMRNAAFSAWHLRLALSAGEPRRIARGLAFELGVAPAAGRESLRWAKERALPLAERLSQDSRDPYLLALVTLAKGHVGYLSADFPAAIALLSQAEREFARVRHADAHWARLSAKSMLFYSLAVEGSFSELAARVPVFVREARERGDRHSLALVVFPQTMLALAQDRADHAEQLARDAVTPFRSHSYHLRDFSALHCALLTLRYQGRESECYAKLAQEWPLLESSKILHINMVRVIALGELVTAALAAQGDGERTRRARAQDALRELAREALPCGPAAGSVLTARLAYQDGDVAAARAYLVQASAQFDQLAMPLHAACARRADGVLRADASGRAQVAAADALLKARAVRVPERFVHLLAPGFPSATAGVAYPAQRVLPAPD
jgi:serine/threonine protein kinase